MAESQSLQTEVFQNARGRIVTMDSAYHVEDANRHRDVAVNASYCGVLPARFIAQKHPRGAIGVDCGVGLAGMSIAGLWYLEALNIPGAVADVMTVKLGDGVDLYEKGVISYFNRPAADVGVKKGMSVREAAALMLNNDPAAPTASEVTNRTVVDHGPDGRLVVATDSIAFGLPEDATNVLVTAGHSGRSCLPYLLKCRPYGFIMSDGGMGRENAGIASLPVADAEGIPGGTVDARTTRMGDGLSSYYEGTISAVNKLGEAAGVRVGMSAREAAKLLVNRKPS